jgi:transposase
LRNAVAIAEVGRGGEVRYFGEIPNTEAATRKLVAKLAAKYDKLTFCYEAGPTGYGLYRLIKRLGHDCIVVAPSLIPKKAGDRVKTNRRDGVNLAKCTDRFSRNCSRPLLALSRKLAGAPGTGLWLGVERKEDCCSRESLGRP